MKMTHRMFLALSVSVGFQAALASGQGQPGAPQDAPPVIPAETAPPLPPPVIKVDGATDTKKRDVKKKQEKAAADKKAPAKSKEAGARKAPTASASKPEDHHTLTPGPAVARQPNVNLRGQAAINSEVVTHIKKGELVTVLEEVTLKKPKVDEPARWAKVSLPPGSVVWVSSHFINPSTKAVVPKRLNLRSGPGENYSILGRIEGGYVVKEIEIKGDWMKIEAPTNCYAFIAAHLLSTDPADVGPALAKASPPPPVVPPPPPPVETTLVTPRPVAPPPQPLLVPPPPPPPIVVVTPPPPVVPTPPPGVPTPVPAEESTEKRIVTREGIVRGSASIQAPTYFVLRDLDNNRTINYLHGPSNVVMRSYQYQRVIVTGEEILDERWPNTPVIQVEDIKSVPVP